MTDKQITPSFVRASGCKYLPKHVLEEYLKYTNGVGDEIKRTVKLVTDFDNYHSVSEDKNVFDSGKIRKEELSNLINGSVALKPRDKEVLLHSLNPGSMDILKDHFNNRKHELSQQALAYRDIVEFQAGGYCESRYIFIRDHISTLKRLFHSGNENMTGQHTVWSKGMVKSVKSIQGKPKLALSPVQQFVLEQFKANITGSDIHYYNLFNIACSIDDLHPLVGLSLKENRLIIASNIKGLNYELTTSFK